MYVYVHTYTYMHAYTPTHTDRHTQAYIHMAVSGPLQMPIYTNVINVIYVGVTQHGASYGYRHHPFSYDVPDEHRRHPTRGDWRTAHREQCLPVPL